MEQYINVLEGIKGRHACSAVNAINSFESLAQMLRTDMAIEFITNVNYPDAEAMRSLKCYNLRSRDIFVDEGEIALHNPEMPVISAGTSARITYDGAVKNYSILCMDGSEVTIIAEDWVIIRVFKAPGATVKVIKNGHAMVHISTREGRRK